MKAVVFLVGPTGSGKSELAVELALKFGGEIVSCDSMQIYKGMDIGTDKPPLAHRRRVVHHLIDEIEPSREFSVYEFRNRALRVIEEIQLRGKLPIATGGSGLYIKALWDGIGPHPAKEAALRKELRQQGEREGLDTLHEKLAEVDPSAAKRIHPHDERRIIRALEVYHRTGIPLSEWETRSVTLEDLGYRVLPLGLRRDRQELYERIENRVDRMFRRGLVSEVKRLAKRRLSRTAGQAVSYREMLQFLRGDLELERAEELIKKRTRNVAKKQIIWFRRDPRIEWFDVEGEAVESRIFERICPRVEDWLVKSPLSPLCKRGEG